MPLETLQQAWFVALRADQSLAASRWNAAAAEDHLRAAQADFWPTGDLEMSYTVRSDEPSFRIQVPAGPTSFPFMQDENFGLRAALQLPLYTGGRLRHGVAAAEAGRQVADTNAQTSALDVKMHVAREYVAVLRTSRDLNVYRSQAQSLRAHARDVEMLFRNERVPRNDLLAAQVALSDAEHQVIRAQKQLDSARAAYNRRLQRPLIAPVNLAGLPPPETHTDFGDLNDRAARFRPELIRSIARVEQLRYRAQAVTASKRPQVHLEAAYSFQENRFQVPEGIASAGLNASWNVFDARRKQYNASELHHRAARAESLHADLESLIRLEVRNAWLDVNETRRRIGVTRGAIERAQENLRVARRRYVLGAATNTEVLDAEVLRTRIYHKYHNAVYDAILAALRLRRATGEL